MLKILQRITIIIFLFVLVTSRSAAAPAKTDVAKLNENINFLTLSDIHFDPFLSCQNKNCSLIDKLRKAPANQWPQILGASDTSLPRYGDDTNYPLLNSTLTAAQKIAQTQHVKFVMVLGDFLGHDYKNAYMYYSGDKSANGYRLFVLKTLQFISNQLHQAFPAIDIYSVIGNNDSYGGDYVTNSDGQFFHDVAKVWAPLIAGQSNQRAVLKDFSNHGYYAVVLPGQINIRLILLNTNLFSYKAQGKNVDKAAIAELNWLHQQLEIAQQKKQKVFIVMHIPEGIDVYASLRVKLFTLMELWKSQYMNLFQNEVKQYASEIDAILAGHLHSDWFQILTLDKNEIPVSGTPSVSPIFGNNPGFKVYNYSLDTQELQDFATYYYPLSSQHSWTKEYDFNHVYQSNCPGCPIIKGMELIEETGNLAEHYKSFYSVGTSNQPIVDKWYPYYWCAIRQMNAQGYKECVR